jgi:hypothetical protein
MIEIDHICLGVRNVYEGAHRLREETGLGNYEGGWFPDYGLANRIVPIGGNVYIEVEGIIDVSFIERQDAGALWWDKQVADGDAFIGWCARVTSRSELEAMAKRLNRNIEDSTLRVRPDGSSRPSYRVPDSVSCWMKGIPNFFYTEDMSRHPAALPIGPGPGIAPGGVAWMELGGTPEEMSDWLGIKAEMLGLRFNGQSHGLYAVAVNTPAGEVVIRRKPIRL